MGINSITHIDQLLQASEKAQIYCSKVDIITDDSKTVDGYLAVISHSLSNSLEDNEYCLVLLQETNHESSSPIVLKAIPICSGLKVEIAQQSKISNDSNPEKDQVVVFSVKQALVKVRFVEKKDMLEILDKVKQETSAADLRNKSSSNKNTHQWIKRYTDLTIGQNTIGSYSSRTRNNMNNPTNTLRYVMPIQRAETLTHINLKRTRDVSKPKEHHISFESAKDHYINAQLMKREGEFVEWKKTTAFVGTWNIHGSSPNVSLEKWLQGTLKTKNGEAVDPDFYVIGLEEIGSSPSAYFRYEPTVENGWVNTILNSLKDNGKDYYKVESKQLVTILLVVIAKKRHEPYISEISSTYAGIGLLNMLGNKGGIGVRFRFHDSYLCFVASHLAAFTEQIDKRNQDFTELTKRLFFPNQPDPVTDYLSYYWNDGGDEGVSYVESQDIVKDWTKEASLFHSDVLVWCGDLNYRVNLHESIIKTQIRNNQLDELLEYDQLSIERSAGRTFQMFDEGHIAFAPTYKYDPGTDTYDTSEKRRAPSWTDRVLWKKSREDATNQTVELLDYTNCQEMMISDHKPVRALMNLNIRKVDSQLQEATKNKIKQVLKESKDTQPRGRISTSFVSFKEVRFMEYKERNILLENKGQVVIAFKFLPDENTGNILPPWLQVTPLSGVIAPADKVLIRFELLVDPTVSAPLNNKTDEIYQILTLRLENCDDYLIQVTGEYKPTCFGVPLEELSVSNSNSNINDGIPIQLKKLVEFLWNDNLFSIESLFLKRGELNISTYVRKCLDKREDFDVDMLLGSKSSHHKSDADISQALSELSIDKDQINEKTSANSMIDVLVAFLDCLPEPVVPTSMYEQALEASSSVDSVNKFVCSLPDLRKNIILFVGKFLKEAVSKSPTSAYEKRKKAIVELFTVLLRAPINFKEQNPLVAEDKRKKFVNNLLESISTK